MRDHGEDAGSFFGSRVIDCRYLTVCDGAHDGLIDVGGWRRLGETCKRAGCSLHEPVHCSAISAVVYMLTEELYLPGR